MVSRVRTTAPPIDTTADTSASARRKGAQNKQESSSSGEPPTLRPGYARIDRVYKVKASAENEDDALAAYVAMPCDAPERERRVLIMQNRSDRLNWNSIYARAVPIDEHASAVVFRMTDEEMAHVAKIMLRQYERNREVKTASLDDCSYFSALAHACKCRGIEWHITDVVDVKHSNAAQLANDMFLGVGDYAPVVSENNSGANATLAYDILKRLRKPIDHIMRLPLDAAHELCSVLVGEQDDSVLGSAKETQLYNREKRMNVKTAYVLDDVLNGTDSARPKLVAHILYDLAKRSDARSSARTLIALRMMQETRMKHLRADATDAQVFSVDAAQIMSSPDIIEDLTDNEFVKRGCELYRRVLTSYTPKDNRGFAQTFGMDTLDDKKVFDKREIEGIVSYVRHCNLFDPNYAVDESHRSEHTLLKQLVLHTLNALYSDIRDDLFSEDFERRVALLCAIRDHASQQCVFTHIIATILKCNLVGDESFSGDTLRINLVLLHARTRLKVFAFCFALMCRVCKSHSALAESMCRIARDVRERSARYDTTTSVTDDNVEESASSTMASATRASICAYEKDEKVWDNSRFDPEATDAAMIVFRHYDADSLETCIKSLSYTARAIDFASAHDASSNMHRAVLGFVSNRYHGDKNVSMSVRAPNSDNEGVTSFAASLDRNTLVHQVAVARYFSKILWTALKMSKTIRDCRIGGRLPPQLNSTKSIILLAASYKPELIREYMNDDERVSASHNVLSNISCNCVSALASRYGRADDAEDSIILNASNGVHPLDNVATTALYLDYLVSVWHDFDTCMTLMRAHWPRHHSCANGRSSGGKHAGTSDGYFSNISGANLSGHLMFLRMLNESADEFAVRSCAWLCPPDSAVAKFVGADSANKRAENRRELVRRCCIPVAIATHPMVRGSVSSWHTDLWMMRFTTCPFVDVSNIVRHYKPQEGHTYRVRTVPPPLSSELQNDIDKYVRK